MVKLRSRLARLGTAGVGIALLGPVLTLSAAGSAQAQVRAVTPATAGCATGSGVTGSATQKGTDYTKQDDGCPNFILNWAQGSGNFAGFYKQNGVWHEGTAGYLACSATCNRTLLTSVLPNTLLTVNNKTAGDGDDPIQVSF
jgi:hypothetical protein